MKVTLKFAKCEPWLKRKKLDEKIILINKTLGYFIVFLSPPITKFALSLQRCE